MGFDDLVKVYIENLNLPSETKVKLLASNPKTLADVSLWLENNKEVKTEDKSSFNPFSPQIKTPSAKEIELFSQNSGIKSQSAGFLYNKDALVDTDDASWGLSLDRSQASSEVQYYSAAVSNNTKPQNTTSAPSSAAAQSADSAKKEAQDNAITSIKENINSAIETVMQQSDSQGTISKAYNSIKEYFDTEMSKSNVCRVIFAEKTAVDLLERAQKGELTREEYYNTKIDEAITLLTGGKQLSSEDRKLLKERLSNYTPEQLNQLIDRIKYCNNDDYAKLNEKVDQLIEEERTKSYVNNLPDGGSLSIKSIIQNSDANGKELMTFEDVWKMERGVDFNPEAIKEYDTAATEYTMAAIVSNKAENLHNLLKDSMTLVKGNNQYGVDDRTREAGERQLESQLLTALKSLYGEDENKINQELQKISNGAISYKDGQIVYNEYSKNNKGYCLADSAQKLLDSVDSQVAKLLDGKTVEDYKNSMASAYETAYGRKNATQLAQAFANDQEEVVGKVRAGVEYAGIGVMVAGMFIYPPAALAGALTSSFGGIGVEALNETTRKDGISEEKKQELLKELTQNAALFAVGGGAAKMGNAARAALIAKKCPVFMQVAADIGVDSTISLLGDLAITGQINIEGEGLSQLMSLVAGHIKAGKFRHKANSNVESKARNDNDITTSRQNSVSKQLTPKEIAQKLGCEPDIAQSIEDIIKSKPEIKDKLTKLLDSGRIASEIKELLQMATPENIDDLISLSKNQSLGIDYDMNGNVAVNNFADALEIIKANPQYKTQLMDIAANTNRPVSDISRIAEFTQKYPEYAEEICSVVKSNRNIKVGHSLNPNAPSHIDEYVELLRQNPELAAEIKQYASVQRRADNDTTNPMRGLKRFVEIIKENPDKKDLYVELSKNHNLDADAINLLTGRSSDPQYVKDLIALSSKNYDEGGINYNIRLMNKHPELREILLEEPPEFDFIDRDVTKTPQSTLEKRFDIRDKIEKTAPEELKKLQKTLGEKYFHKIKWEDIIPENASPQEIKQILSELNETSKFFSRIAFNEELYGKNIQWAHQMDVISRSAAVLISKGESYETVMDHIAIMYRTYDISTTRASNVNPSDRRQDSGKSREYLPDSEFAKETGFSYITSFNEKGGYSEYYDRFMKLLNKKRTPPYPDVELTQISLVNGYGYVMGHPRNSSVSATMAHVKQRYEELTPLFEKVRNGGVLTAQEKAMAHDKIAEMYFLMANAMPYARGSNGIADIYMRSMYKELGIDMPALKPGVSLDLEAFCMDLKEYKKKWHTFFEK